MAAVPHAFFLTAPQGPRFALVHAPGDGEPVRAVVLLAPPFAEELNKSRRMLALQARALVEAGCAVLLLDLGGCGDSAGEFAEASWSGWIDDLQAGAAWLRARWPSAPLVLWGVRAGCLLACALIDRLPVPPAALLAWQPPADGRSLLQQFLRLKVYGDAIGTPVDDSGAAAAALVSSGGDGGGGNGGVMAQLKAELAAGRAVMVAGYVLPAAVADGLAAATLSPPPAGATPLPSAWMELSSRPDATPSPTLLRLAQRWAGAGHPVTPCVVDGPAFWLTAEIEEAPALIAAGVEAVDGWLAQRGAMTEPGTAAMPAAAAAAAATPAVVVPDETALPAAALPTWAQVGPGVDEEALVFDAGGAALVGVLSRPAGGDRAALHPLGVVIVVGGPQYRVGSHRQFVHMARALARAGHAVLRFDVRGMGDGDGAARGFEALDDDIAAALQALRLQAPALRGAVLLGLCDGASAALLYLQRRGDPFVRGLVVLNPWVRSAATHAAAQVKHYYVDRLRSPAFWRKLLGGGVKWSAAGELLASVRAMRAGRTSSPADARADGGQVVLPPGAAFQERMAAAWWAFSHPVLLLLSGRDHTAREFEEAVAAGGPWTGALKRPGLTVRRLSGADHTLSDPGHSRLAEQAVSAWIASASASAGTVGRS